MKIFLANDHAGFLMKNIIKDFIKNQFPKNEIIDLGTNSEESVDYPKFGKLAGQEVIKNPESKGIIFCGTGIGISIAANKIQGIRAANCSCVTTTKLARQHNNANILAIGARIFGPQLIKEMVTTFLETDFLGGRHKKRIEIICTNSTK